MWQHISAKMSMDVHLPLEALSSGPHHFHSWDPSFPSEHPRGGVRETEKRTVIRCTQNTEWKEGKDSGRQWVSEEPVGTRSRLLTVEEREPSGGARDLGVWDRGVVAPAAPQMNDLSHYLWRGYGGGGWRGAGGRQNAVSYFAPAALGAVAKLPRPRRDAIWVNLIGYHGNSAPQLSALGG